MNALDFLRLHFDYDEADAEFEKTLSDFLTPESTP